MPPTDVLNGALELLALRALRDGPLHGYAIARHIQGISRDQLRVEEGSLYPALHRLQKRGWVEAEWGLSENNRRAKYYRLTDVGRGELRAETTSWRRYAAAVVAVLDLEQA